MFYFDNQWDFMYDHWSIIRLSNAVYTCMIGQSSHSSSHWLLISNVYLIIWSVYDRIGSAKIAFDLVMTAHDLPWLNMI